MAHILSCDRIAISVLWLEICEIVRALIRGRRLFAISPVDHPCSAARLAPPGRVGDMRNGQQSARAQGQEYRDNQQALGQGAFHG